MTHELKQAAQQVLESLEEIALAGMSGTQADPQGWALSTSGPKGRGEQR